MTTLYTAFDNGLSVAHQRKGTWEVSFHLTRGYPECLAVDPLHPQYVYCGTTYQGLWQSADAGTTWEKTGEGIASGQVTAVAVSGLDQATNGRGIVYAGTEPSALFRSEDQGKSWQELPALLTLPSASTWRFPPRPWISHIRWIAPDPLVAGRVFVAIEAGALVRSLDGGLTWEDRTLNGPLDTHTLVLPPLAPNRVYSASGDGPDQPEAGFVQSDDAGETWLGPNDGLAHHYLWSMAVDPGNPETVVISAAHGPQQAHNLFTPEAVIYRRSGGSSWHMVSDGLPPARGSLASVLTSHKAEPGVFYAANNHGVFRSSDSGLSWEALPIPWPAGTHLGRAHAIVVVPE